MANRGPYCPRNGCGMPNGAAPAAVVQCKACDKQYKNFDKVCPSCRTCSSCERVGKRWYKEPQMAKKSVAEQIVEKVLSNLQGRSGIGNAIDGLDDEIKNEMTAELVEEVQTVLDEDID